MKQAQANKVDSQTNTTNNEHQVWVVDMFIVEHPLNGLNKDGETERHEED